MCAADVNNVGHHNKVGALRRDDGVNAAVPITVTDILNCNTIEAANNLLARIGLAKRDNGIDITVPSTLLSTCCSIVH